MTPEALRELVQSRLPRQYEPLLLSFGGGAAGTQGDRVPIGDDYGTTLCCDLGSGHVLSVDADGKLPTRFVNSGIEELGQFIDEYEEVRQRLHGTPGEAEQLQLASGLRSRLLEIDPRALAEPDHWWSVICEQLEAGLL